jgi:uncharacterized RDD family membrane protein YckC
LDSSTPILAPITARLLALFIDYIFLSALIFFIGKTLGHSDFIFIPTLLITGFYFTFCNSELGSGQSLGKKVLGLRVIGCSNKVFIDPAASALRYLLSFGMIILLSEVPVLAYRQLNLVAEPFFLELHMMAVMVFASVSLLFAALTKSKQSLHDIVCKTRVVRASEAPEVEDLDKIPNNELGKDPFIVFVIATFFAIVLWSFGVIQPQSVASVAAHKYELENAFDIRIVSMGVASGAFELIALAPVNEAKDKEDLAEKLGNYLLEQKLVTPENMGELLFLLHGEEDTERPVVLHFDTKSRTVKTVKPKSL